MGADMASRWTAASVLRIYLMYRLVKSPLRPIEEGRPVKLDQSWCVSHAWGLMQE